jgi:hypothetical protein
MPEKTQLRLCCKDHPVYATYEKKGEEIAVQSEKNKKRINTPSWQNAGFMS